MLGRAMMAKERKPSALCLLLAPCTLLLLVLAGEGDCACNRKYNSDQPDCSAAMLSDGHSAETYIPCLVKTGASVPLEQLEFPQDNTHTCYRTCIDSDTNQCQATLVTNVHNRQVPTIVMGRNYELRIFSQGFLRTTNQKYRKSSICRYKVKCRSNQVLSYSILTHALEEPGFCGNSSACMDSLSLQFPGMGATETTCGRLTDSSTHNDGSSELHIEFNSNRENELNGFLIAALCVDPRLTRTSSSRQSRSVESDQASGGTVEECNTPAIWKRNGHEEEGHEEESDDHNGTDPALLKLAHAFTVHREKILDPSALHITVDMWGHVTYSNGTITIDKDGSNMEVMEFHGILTYHLANRFLHDAVFRHNAPGHYHGYGYIVFWNREAFFLQDGMNPEFRPSPEETAAIQQLQQALQEAITAGVLSTEEETWVTGEEEPAETNETVPSPANKRLTELLPNAWFYSTACNALLRSTACAYLKLVTNTPCEQDRNRTASGWSASGWSVPSAVDGPEPTNPTNPTHLMPNTQPTQGSESVGSI